MPQESWLFDQEWIKKFFFPTIAQNTGSRNTKQDKYKEQRQRTKHNAVIFSIIKQWK